MFPTISVAYGRLKRERASVSAQTRPPQRQSIERLARSVIAILFLIECVGLVALFVGPRRFEHASADVVARTEFRLLRAGRVLGRPPGDPGAAGPFDALLERLNTGDLDGARALFAPKVWAVTWLGDKSVEETLPPSGLQTWLVGIKGHLSVRREGMVRAGGVSVEAIWADADDLRSSGIVRYEVVYLVRSHNGQIDAVAAFFDPRVVHWTAPRSGIVRESPQATPGVLLALIALIMPLVGGVVLFARGRLGLGVAGIVFPVVAVTILASTSLGSPASSDLATLIPGPIRYQVHVISGTFLDDVNAPAPWSAVEWAKAASHAQTDADESLAARGIARSRARATNLPALDGLLCRIADTGSPRVIGAIQEAGTPCPSFQPRAVTEHQ